MGKKLTKYKLHQLLDMWSKSQVTRRQKLKLYKLDTQITWPLATHHYHTPG